MSRFSKLKERLKCNKPASSPRSDKSKVVKACKDGKEKLIHFGDPSMPIKKSDPKRRKSFRARHKCDDEATKNNKLSARHWSCKAW